MNNERPFTCIGKSVKDRNLPVLPATRADMQRMRRDSNLAKNCRLILNGDESLKSQLPFWTPHCDEFRNNHRSNEDALRPLQRLMMDIDVKGCSQEILARALELHGSGKWEVLLVEESVRKGTHVLISLPIGMTAEEAQQRFSDDIGYPVDPAVKDPARCIFLVPESYVLYENEALYEPVEAVPVAEACQPVEPVSPTGTSDSVPPSGTFPDEFKGIPYADIIRAWFVFQKGYPQQGERNTKLFKLATHLRSIVDNNEAHLLQIMPRFGLSEAEMKAIIHHACSGKTGSSSRVIENIVSVLSADTNSPAQVTGGCFFTSETPPEMPARLPSLIALLVSNTPEVYRPTVAHAVFPSLATHLWKVSFRYIDNLLHEATLMNVVMANSSTGKGCINEPINRIMESIRKRDRLNLKREKEWKVDSMSKGANKDKKKRPEGIIVQEISADTTPAAFLMRMVEADGRFLYAKMNEIERMDALKLSGKNDTQFQIICYAFDSDNEFGADRVGIASVNERVKLRFNFNACTTIGKGRAYFRRVLTDGPINRINFCTIPEQPIGADMPVFGTYDDTFDAKLRPYLEHLDNARGIIDCPEAWDLANRLKKEMADVAVLTQSRVFETLSFRAMVIAYLKACVLYVANGYRWEEEMDDFIRWSLQYDLYCKMRFFGDAIACADETAKDYRQNGPKNLLELLPDTFTREDAQLMRQSQGIVSSGNNTSSMLQNWKNRGYIRAVGEKPSDRNLQQYTKTEEYLKKFSRK